MVILVLSFFFFVLTICLFVWYHILPADFAVILVCVLNLEMVCVFFLCDAKLLTALRTPVLQLVVAMTADVGHLKRICAPKTVIVTKMQVVCLPVGSNVRSKTIICPQ